MSDNNLKLWESVSKTDTKFTKYVEIGKRKFTSISPMYQKREATNAFGPQGINWGVVLGSEKFDYREIGDTTLLVYTAVMYFTHEGSRGEIPIAATEKLSYKTAGTNGYLKIDDEADKKVKTNALTKGLSELGFSADIFLGLFDDVEYKQLRKLESDLARAENFEVEQKDGFDETLTWLNREISTIKLLKSESVITMVTNKIDCNLKDKMKILKASKPKLDSYIKKLHDAAQSTINQLKSKQNGK